jgi:hypothetical protein
LLVGGLAFNFGINKSNNVNNSTTTLSIVAKTAVAQAEGDPLCQNNGCYQAWSGCYCHGIWPGFKQF